MRRRASLVLIPLAALALLVGCGDGDGADAKATTTTAVLPPEWAGADFLPQGGGDAPAVAAPEDVDFCDAYNEARVASDALRDTSQEEPSDDSLEDLKAGMATLLEKVDALVAAAPEEAQEQLDGIADTIDEVAASVSGATTLEEALEATAAIATNQDFVSVSQHLSLLASTRCPAA